MITIRKGVDRGHASHGWLEAKHSFSFASYHHPERMGWRSLRVINEDVVQPGAGFAPHSHRDMEIVTYVLEGALEHKDSTGGGGIIRPGDVQYMCAGSGVTHSEFNASKSEPVHLYQIWILPNAKGLKPGYAQKSFGDERKGRLRVVASPDGRDGSIPINQDALIFAGVFAEGAELERRIDGGRFGWLQVARGGVETGGALLQAGDAALLEGEDLLSFKAAADAEVIFFDLA